MDIILLMAFASSVTFFLYEFSRIRYLWYEKEISETIIPRFSDIGKIKEETTESKIEMRLKEIEDSISEMEKRMNKYEDVISKLIEKLSG